MVLSLGPNKDFEEIDEDDLIVEHINITKRMSAMDELEVVI
jgi:hypothetical protein